MAARAPRRADGTKRPRKMSSSTAGHHTPLERSYAQMTRHDRREKGVSYASKSKRAAFWAGIQARAAAEQKRSVDAASSMLPVTSLNLAGANVHAATLESALPTPPGSGISVAGLDSQGYAPPPATGIR